MCVTEKKTPQAISDLGRLWISSGDVLLSHARARAVPSALEDFTSEFEMGSGVAPPTSSPKKTLEALKLFTHGKGAVVSKESALG